MTYKFGDLGRIRDSRGGVWMVILIEPASFLTWCVCIEVPYPAASWKVGMVASAYGPWSQLT